MKVLELFSGIGGMHYALISGEIIAEVVAVEINTVANAVYRHNFPSSILLQKNIVSIESKDLNKFCPEIILMSPPCQPFTRVGLKKDLSDARSDPLKHILSLIPELPSVNYILVENVKGFESSEARNKLIMCLEDLNFDIKEFLISPSQLGVPNVRTRYYLLAKKKPLQFCFKSTGIIETFPEECFKILKDLENSFSDIHLVADIIETDDISSSCFQEHLLSDKLVETRIGVMDIVTKHDTKTCCFTKAYGSYVKGTGSLYCPYDQTTIDNVLNDTTPSMLRTLKLRYFTPREVARLMCFPDDFKFPTEVTMKQKYRLLGNSVNVKVVALLIRLLLFEPSET